jgi:hypothetical protein
MQGLVTTKDLFSHGGLIISEYGPRVFLRCVTACLCFWKTATFLECVHVVH